VSRVGTRPGAASQAATYPWWHSARQWARRRRLVLPPAGPPGSLAAPRPISPPVVSTLYAHSITGCTRPASPSGLSGPTVRLPVRVRPVSDCSGTAPASPSSIWRWADPFLSSPLAKPISSRCLGPCAPRTQSAEPAFASLPLPQAPSCYCSGSPAPCPHPPSWAPSCYPPRLHLPSSILIRLI
jgi:hypothetical protein